MTNEFNPDWMCVCGDLTTLGVVHRKDGTCYIPEPKREWVGLSEDEVAVLMMEAWGCASIAPQSASNFARTIEAKLKEKNT